MYLTFHFIMLLVLAPLVDSALYSDLMGLQCRRISGSRKSRIPNSSSYFTWGWTRARGAPKIRTAHTIRTLFDVDHSAGLVEAAELLGGVRREPLAVEGVLALSEARARG